MFYNVYGSKDVLFLCVFEGYVECYLVKVCLVLVRFMLKFLFNSFFDFIVDWLFEGELVCGCFSIKIVFGGEVVELVICVVVGGLLD